MPASSPASSSTKKVPSPPWPRRPCRFGPRCSRTKSPARKPDGRLALRQRLQRHEMPHATEHAVRRASQRTASKGSCRYRSADTCALPSALVTQCDPIPDRKRRETPSMRLSIGSYPALRRRADYLVGMASHATRHESSAVHSWSARRSHCRCPLRNVTARKYSRHPGSPIRRSREGALPRRSVSVEPRIWAPWLPVLGSS